MGKLIEITSITANTPVDLYYCDSMSANCVFVASVSVFPYEFEVPSPYDEQDIVIQIFDSQECVYEEIILITPTPTISVSPTPTPTITPTITESATPTPTPTETLTPTPTLSVTPTITVTPSQTKTPLPTQVIVETEFRNSCDVFTLFDMGIICNPISHPSSSESFDGILSIKVTGGTTPYSFFWDGGQRSQTLTNLKAGTYGVTVVDYYGDYTASTSCLMIAPSPSPTVTPTMTPTPSSTLPCSQLCVAAIGQPTNYGPWQFVCNGNFNGKQKWTYSTLSYNLVWISDKNRWQIMTNDLTIPVDFGQGRIMGSTNQSNIPLNGWTFFGNIPSEYSFIVQQGECTTIPLNNVLKIQHTNCSSQQNCSGSITNTTTFGVPPYEYSINGGTFSQLNIFNGLCVGDYSIKVRDASGTTLTQNVKITGESPTTSYIISVDSLGFTNYNPSVNNISQNGKYKISINPPLPLGTTLNLNLIINTKIENYGPWINDDPETTASYNILNELSRNGTNITSQLIQGPTSSTTNNREECSPNQVKTTSSSYSINLNISANTTVSGSTTVELNELLPTSLNNCVSEINSSVLITINEAKISGCNCCGLNVITTPAAFYLKLQGVPNIGN